MAPGINGRQTGTVPKTKTHNDSSRDYTQVRREQSFNSIPNNLVTLDWQPAPDTGHSRTRKTSNTHSASLDYYDTVPEGGVPHDNSRFVTPHYPHGEEQQMSWSAVNRSQEANGRSEGSASTSSSSRRSRTPRNVLPDRESKSNNINKMPDRNQVVSRLTQIRDYIKQTSSLMDTLKNSGDSRHLAQYHKLSRMIAELRESEARLQSFLPELGNVSSPEPENKTQDNKSGNNVAESTIEAGNCMPDHVSAGVNSQASPASSSGKRGIVDNSSAGRSHSEEPSGAVLKSSDSARRNELKMKVEESQRRLQVLQEHQAALLTLQQKAQDQLKEAKVAQGILMARAVGVQCSGPPPPPLLPAGEENSAGCTNGMTKDSQGTGPQYSNSSSEIQGNMQHLADRLHNLQELYENRNQLVQMLGERDEELVSEHLVLQDKLQELQYKKQHMDHLVAEFQALNNLPGVVSVSEAEAGSSKAGSENGEGDLSDGEPDYQVVREKIAELNMMKAQLAQLKGIMSAVENKESINGPIQNGLDEGSGAGEECEDLEQEEQAVNLRRQRRDKVKGASSRGVVRSNSNTSATSSTKPDNILQASSELERTRDIQRKTIQLQDARARLQQLQDLLAAVSDFHSRGQTVPEQYIELLNQEASREGGGDATRMDIQSVSVPRVQRHSVERERTPARQHPQDNLLPDGAEVTLEAVQAMTHDIHQQTLCLQEERERLVSARRELSKLQRELPLREKKTNTQVDAQTHQLLLQAELQAKRRELEELMRKDQGQTSAINQDVCSEVSADKSETPGYSFLAEGTTNATWGGSTQGTLDDLAEQDNDIQEQSAGYSSDEGQEDEEEENRTFPAAGSQLRLSQLKNSSTNNSTKDAISQSILTTRDLLSMSLDSSRTTGNINTNHSNSTSVAGSASHVPPPAVGSVRSQRQGPSSHNVWRKESTDSGTSAPRAVWTPSSQQARHENVSSAEELVSSSNLEASNNTTSAGVHNPSLTSNNPSSAWWQQQALQLQHQLEVTSSLCQSMLLEQTQQPQQQQQHGSNLLAALPAGNNALPYWNFPPPSFPTPPHPQAHSIGAVGGHLLPTSIGATTDIFYQHLLAASQLQQQQMLLTTVNQCCHLLWLQQKEMMALRAAVHACSASQPGSWLQPGTSGGTPGLLQGHTTPSPVPALNNQVPPGNRANNYWDNFRSYSRQNLLSTSTKSNEGVSHSPSPLVDRSHNTLRGSMSQSSSLATSGLQPTTVLSQSVGAIYSGPELNGPICNMSRKEKLNTEQYQSIQDNLSLPGPTHNNMTDTSGLHYQLTGAPSSTPISHPRSRNRHNCSDFQLHPNITRSRVTGESQRQSLSNDCITHDLQNISGVRDMVVCAPDSNKQDLPSHHNFVSTTEFHFEPIEARNVSLLEQELQCHQNFPITTESLSAYHGDHGVREEVESSQFLHVSKPQGATGVNKRKNPKIVTSSNSQSQQECRGVADSTTTTTDRKPQQIGNSLFEALSESVYSEVAALISANETRPHFLIQLFRDLQMISSDPLRQRTLQSIQEVVSRYLASGTAANQHTESHCELQANNQQLNQNETAAVSVERGNGSTVSSDDENTKDESTHYHLTESLVGHSGDAHGLPNVIGRCEGGSGSHSIAESEEGAAALLPSAHSSPHVLPRNAAWNIKDGLSLPAELPGRSNKLDWEVQAVLVDLLPFLKAHLDDTCSSTLLEAVRRLTLQLVPAQNLSLVASPTQHSSQHSRLGCYYQGQLDALLEDALLKFQGCRLRDVSEELLTVVAEVLLSELTFLRLVDTVSRGDNNNEGNEECCKNPARDHSLEEHSKNIGTIHQPNESAQQFLTSEIGAHNYCDSQEATLGTEAYNGDLAEADQSRHEDSSMPELEAESAAAISVGNEVSIEHNSQLEGAASVESCLMENATSLTENDHLQVDDMVAICEGAGDFNKTEAEEEWEVEQDREQGLDRVPTRLSTDQQRGTAYSGSSSPERDGHSLVQHPANQIDAPNP